MMMRVLWLSTIVPCARPANIELLFFFWSAEFAAAMA
jgi:hypothetical protein